MKASYLITIWEDVEMMNISKNCDMLPAKHFSFQLSRLLFDQER